MSDYPATEAGRTAAERDGPDAGRDRRAYGWHQASAGWRWLRGRQRRIATGGTQKPIRGDDAQDDADETCGNDRSERQARGFRYGPFWLQREVGIRGGGVTETRRETLRPMLSSESSMRKG